MVPAINRNSGFNGLFSGCCLIAGLFGFLICSPSLEAAPAEKAKGGQTISGLFMRQKATNENYYLVRLSEEAVRVDHFSRDFYVISKAPDWTVYVIRPRQRTMSQVSHKDWCEKYNLREGAWTSLLEKPLKVTPLALDGRKGRVYLFGETLSTNISENLFQSRVGSSVERRLKGRNHAELTYFDFPHSSETGPVIGRLQNLPNLDGIPYSAQRKFDDGRVNGALLTSVIKNSRFPAAIYEIPAGLKKVDFNSHMVTSQAQLDNASDLFKEFLAK